MTTKIEITGNIAKILYTILPDRVLFGGISAFQTPICFTREEWEQAKSEIDNSFKKMERLIECEEIVSKN